MAQPPVLSFETLPPNLRCWALVGRFLQSWSFVEAEINRAISKALGLNSIEAAIVTSNIQFRDKIHILKTIVDNTPMRPEGEQARVKAVISKIADYASTTRNMMAHDCFGPSEDQKSVAFLVTKAKGSLQFPDIVWSVTKFNEADAQLDAWVRELENVTQRLQTAASNVELAKALMGVPTSKPTPPGSPGLLSHLLQANHKSDTNPATPETAPRTPLASEE